MKALLTAPTLVGAAEKALATIGESIDIVYGDETSVFAEVFDLAAGKPSFVLVAEYEVGPYGEITWAAYVLPLPEEVV